MRNDVQWILVVIEVDCAIELMVIVDGSDSGCCQWQRQGARLIHVMADEGTRAQGQGQEGKGGQGGEGKGKGGHGGQQWQLEWGQGGNNNGVLQHWQQRQGRGLQGSNDGGKDGSKGQGGGNAAATTAARAGAMRQQQLQG